MKLHTTTISERPSRLRLRSSRLHILDVKPDPRQPKLVKVIEAEEIARKAGYSRPHTVHCGPEGIYVSALGNAEGKAPGGVFLLDHESFNVLGRWELDRGPQELADRLVPDLAASGEVRGFFLTGVDITERHAAEQAVRAHLTRSNERYRSLIRAPAGAQ